LVSIVITAYNYGRFVGTAIESALAQRYEPLEVLVLDNASTDDTAAVVARYAQDARLRSVRHPENIGLTPNHNRGLELARGELIGFLSADDAFAPDFVARAVRFYREHPGIDVLYGGAYFTDEAGRVLQVRAWPGQPEAAYAGGRNELAVLLAEGAYMCMPTMLVPRRIWEAWGPFDGELVSADWELTARWAARGVRFAFDPEPVAFVRLHGEQNSGLAKNNATGREMRDYVTIFERYLDPAAPARYAGHEPSLRRVIERRAAYVRDAFGAELADEFAPATARLQARVDAIAGANRTRERERIAFVVVAGDAPGALQTTLASLVAQADPRWRAVVVQDAGQSLGPLCAHIDPERIRHLRLPARRGFAFAVGTAVTIEDADAYVVLRAGALVGPGHLGAVRAAFAAPPVDVALCGPPGDIAAVPPLGPEYVAFSLRAFTAIGWRDVALPEWDFAIRASLTAPPVWFEGDVTIARHPPAPEAVAQIYRTFPVTDVGRLAERAAFTARLRAELT
jgi:glycosyltransferase involved in cell wall biosynthesis